MMGGRGRLQPACALQPGPIDEPNNRFGNELCAVANATQAYGNAWGWADTKCSNTYISMCIVRGECIAKTEAGNTLLMSTSLMRLNAIGLATLLLPSPPSSTRWQASASSG
jgi:hypothetical protein